MQIHILQPMINLTHCLLEKCPAAPFEANFHCFPLNSFLARILFVSSCKNRKMNRIILYESSSSLSIDTVKYSVCPLRDDFKHSNSNSVLYPPFCVCASLRRKVPSIFNRCSMSRFVMAAVSISAKAHQLCFGPPCLLQQCSLHRY